MNYKKKYIIALTFFIGAVICAGIAFFIKELAVKNYFLRVQTEEARAVYETAYGLSVIKGSIDTEPQTSVTTAEELKKTVIKMPLSAQASKRIHEMLNSIIAGAADEKDIILLDSICNTLNGEVDNKSPSEIVNCIEQSVTGEPKKQTAYAENISEPFRNNEKVQNDFKKIARRIIDSRASFTVAEYSPVKDLVLCYCKNLYLEVKRESQSPYFFFYDCNIGSEKLSDEECQAAALSFTLRNLPKSVKGTGAVIESLGGENGVAAYTVTIGDKAVWLKIRRDTGKTIYFDATELF